MQGKPDSPAAPAVRAVHAPGSRLSHERRPLVRLGQGAYRRDYFPEDFSMSSDEIRARTREVPAATRLDLRFLIREPAEVYHAKSKDYLTAHALNDFRRCPLLYRRKELGLVPERDSAAYLVGRAAHTLILEGRQRYEREYAIGGPINP